MTVTVITTVNDELVRIPVARTFLTCHPTRCSLKQTIYCVTKCQFNCVFVAWANNLGLVWGFMMYRYVVKLPYYLNYHGAQYRKGSICTLSTTTW